MAPRLPPAWALQAAPKSANILIGGGSSINGHIQLTDQVNLVGCSNVAQSVTQSGTYGYPNHDYGHEKMEENHCALSPIRRDGTTFGSIRETVGREMKPLSIHEIIHYLPHRYPFLMIDKVVDYNETWLRAIKNVTVNEPYFTERNARRHDY